MTKTETAIPVFTVPQEKFYVLDLENWHERAETHPSLKTIAEAVYGRTYHAIHWTEPRDNDTMVEVNFNKKTCKEIMEWGEKQIKIWLALNPAFQGRDNPGPNSNAVIADLILKGHLPFGKYLINLSY